MSTAVALRTDWIEVVRELGPNCPARAAPHDYGVAVRSSGGAES